MFKTASFYFLFLSAFFCLTYLKATASINQERVFWTIDGKKTDVSYGPFFSSEVKVALPSQGPYAFFYPPSRFSTPSFLRPVFPSHFSPYQSAYFNHLCRCLNRQIFYENACGGCQIPLTYSLSCCDTECCCEENGGFEFSGGGGGGGFGGGGFGDFGFGFGGGGAISGSQSQSQSQSQDQGQDQCQGDDCGGDVPVPEPKTWLILTAMLGLVYLLKKWKDRSKNSV